MDLLQTGELHPVISPPLDNDINHTTETPQNIEPPTMENQPPAIVPADESPTSPPRHTSTRTRALPTKFKDYVMNV